ncbi:MAG: hypothetical protein U9Q06_00685 [Nanoarchaeota archaeon]|nr:hypothetical protein [Nanoarchaeota archaeon]
MESQYISDTANVLVQAAERLPDSEFSIGAMCCPAKEGAPSVKDAFEAFEGLPDDHPLKKQFDPGQVRAGYEALELFSFDATKKDYYQLALSLPN